jgi:type II secretory pathway component PulF
MFSPFEIEILVAGEKSGKLPEAFQGLAKHHEKQAERIRNILQRLAYPTLLVHAAIFGPNLFILMQQGKEAYFQTVFSLLAVVYAIVLTPIILWIVSKKTPGLASIAEQIAFSIPLLGSFLLKNQTSQSVAVWQALYSAGVPIVSSFDHVIKTSNSETLRNTFDRIQKQLANGLTLREATAKETILPKKLRDMIATGEISGNLEKTLATVRDVLEQEADLSMKYFTSIFGTLAFILVAGFVVYQIVQFYTRYFSALSNIGH